MKSPQPNCVSGNQGFTLVEVLVALAMAAIGFGVVLHSVGQQMTLVATSVDRHQMLLYASQALETGMARGVSGEEEVEEQPIGRQDENQDDSAVQPAEYFYKLESKPVTADPRVQQVSVTVRGNRGRVKLGAYRLRVRRGSE